MQAFWLNYFFAFNLLILLSLASSQTSSSIVLLDSKYENEPFYYDLSYSNSSFTNFESVRNRFGINDRNGLPTTKHSCSQIRQIPPNIRNDLKLTYFYQKYTEAYGIPVIGSNKVSTNALRRTCYVLRFYLASNNEIKEAFFKRNVRIVVLAASENLLNLPEYDSLPVAWNSLRGLSATPSIPLITVGEENVQCSNDKLKAEDLLFHQFSYSTLTLDVLNENLKKSLNDSYQLAKNSVPWKNTFQLADRKEYFASGVDAYFGVLGKKDSIPFTLDDLKRHDKYLVELIQKVFPCDNNYLTKCKSSRESEMLQVLKQGKNCDYEASNVLVATTLPVRITSPVTVEQFSNNEQANRQNQQSTNTQSPSVVKKITSPRPSREPIKVSTTTVVTRPPSSSTTTTKLASLIESFDNTESRVDDCQNLNENCENWALKGECNRNRQFMHIECKKSCNLCNGGRSSRPSIKTITTTQIDRSIFESLCKDEFAHCPVFALRGDCKTNPHHMLDKCKRSCNLCGDLVHQKDRIQPTSKKIQLRRPVTPSPAYNRSPQDDPSYNDFLNNNNYRHNQIASTTDSFARNNYYDSYARSSPITKSTTYGYATNEYRVERTQTPPKETSSDSCKDQVGHCYELAQRGDCETNRETMEFYCSKSCRFC